jgi:hypothetical protein
MGIFLFEIKKGIKHAASDSGTWSNYAFEEKCFR